MKKIKIGIYGYGNLGKGVEIALKNNSDMELVGVFTRRDPDTIETIFNDTKVYSAKEINNMKGKIDVMVLCGGSATDLPVQTPEIASMFNVVDSFDNHANIEKHFNNVNQVSKENNTLALISCGWDPGLFSLNRALFEAVLPNGTNYVFYGRGLSQGHSDAIRRIKGVKKAVQYTVPYEESVKKVKNGEDPKFSSVREVMWRECFVVLEEEADSSKIEKEIKEMPNYFEPYNTEVHFISEEEFNKNHIGMPHGGFVLRSGKTGENTKQIAEFSLNLESNPEFTASVLVAYTRAVYRLSKEGNTGALTVLDIPIAYLTNKTQKELLNSTL